MRLAAVALLTACLVGGCDVGQDGKTCTTTIAPGANLTSALTAQRPGNVLCLRGGNYNGNINATVTAATATNPVVVQSVRGERPIIRGLFWVSGASYWTFNNIDVTWPTSGATSSQQMVRIRNAHHWRYTGSELWGARSSAALGLNTTVHAFTIDRNYIHDTYPSNGTNQDHLIYVETNAGSTLGTVGVIERNLLINSPNGRALKIGFGSGSTAPTGGVTIRYNTMVNNLGPSNVQVSYGASRNLIERNIMDRVRTGYANVTRFAFSGSGNVARNNVGWHSTRVVDAGPGLTDGGGNLHIDPQLDAAWRPQNPAARAYGVYG